MNTLKKMLDLSALDKKLDSKNHFTAKQKQEYSKLMINAFLAEGITEQNQERFSNVFIATGIHPLIKVLNATPDQISLFRSILGKTNFKKNNNARLRFLMQLFLYYTHQSERKNTILALSFIINKISSLKKDVKGNFRKSNITLFVKYILAPWKSEYAITEWNDEGTLNLLREFIQDCLQEDNKEYIKKHKNYKAFFMWLNKIIKNESIDSNNNENNIKPSEIKPISQIMKNESKTVPESTCENATLSLKTIIDCFEKKIVDRNNQIVQLTNMLKEERLNAQNMRESLTAQIASLKLKNDTEVKVLKEKMDAMVKEQRQKDKTIAEIETRLKEQDSLLKNNDVRFNIYFKQRMTSLEGKLKTPFSDLKDFVNDLDSDDKAFMEESIQEILADLKKEGIVL